MQDLNPIRSHREGTAIIAKIPGSNYFKLCKHMILVTLLKSAIVIQKQPQAIHKQMSTAVFHANCITKMAGSHRLPTFDLEKMEFQRKQMRWHLTLWMGMLIHNQRDRELSAPTSPFLKELKKGSRNEAQRGVRWCSSGLFSLSYRQLAARCSFSHVIKTENNFVLDNNVAIYAIWG